MLARCRKWKIYIIGIYKEIYIAERCYETQNYICRMQTEWPLHSGAPVPAPSTAPARHARPLHPHAYVTFGAGMNQKDVDIHTADNRLDGVDPVTGEARSAAVPYHIPM